MENFDNSDYGVELRRKFVAEKYLSGVPTQIIWKEYSSDYGLSFSSLEKDITVVREMIAGSVSLKDNIDEITNSQLLTLMNLRKEAQDVKDWNTVIKCTREITNLLKLVYTASNKASNSGVNVTFNTQNNNVNLPEMSVEEIKKLLGK